MRAYKLAWRNFCRQKVRSGLAVLGIVIGITTLVFFWAVADGANNIATYKQEQTLGMREIKVMPKDQNNFFMGLRSKQQQLDNDAIVAIKGLSHVESVYPLWVFKYPTSLEIALVGRNFETDSPLYAMEAAAMQTDEPDFKDRQDYVPVLVSTGLMEVYNAGIAPSMGLPAMDSALLSGLNLKVFFGYSSIFNLRAKTDAVTQNAKIVGFSNRVPLTGITVPKEVIERLRPSFPGEIQETMISASVTVDQEEQVEAVSKQIKELGYSTTSLADLLANANKNINILRLVLSTVSLVILFVSLLNIINLIYGLVKERTREIGILRAIGRTQWYIFKLFLWESAIIGLVGGLIGVGAGSGLAVWANHYFAHKLPFILEDKITIVLLSWPTVVGALLFSVFLSIISGVYPAYMASRLRPLTAIRKAT